MPPRYAYWTILVDDQPTAFRAGAKEDLLPTFNRLKEKHASATMMWFQNGKLWPSRLDAQEAMRARGEMGRRGDERQAGFRSRDSAFKPRAERPEWRPRSSTYAKAPVDKQASGPKSPEKLEWKPKGEFTPAPKRPERPEWKPKSSFDRERKPKGSFDRDRKAEWKPKGSFDRDRKPEWKPKGSFDRERKSEWKPRGKTAGARFAAPAGDRKTRGEKLAWTPKSQASTSARATADKQGPKSPEKRKWVPKEEYKKSRGIEAKRDSKWRPGGEHRDPKQKYKDAKKAKWTRFKKAIKTRWEDKKKS